MTNGSFLESRGAVHGALSASDFEDDEIRRSWSALRYGSWTTEELLSTWQLKVSSDNEWRERKYEGYKVDSLDITGFWRPKYKGKGTRPKYGNLVRPLPRTRLENEIEATPAEKIGIFVYQGRTIRYEAWHNLVTATTKVHKQNRTVSIHAFYDPHYLKPMVLATDIVLEPETVYLVYRERWPVEHLPLASKQMIGLHRQFVSSDESCQRQCIPRPTFAAAERAKLALFWLFRPQSCRFGL